MTNNYSKTVDMEKRDFTNIKPSFESDSASWYLDDHFIKYLKGEQAENLPPLQDLACFIVHVKKEDVFDYVLIDNQQNILDAYPYTTEGFEQMEARINIMKISKHYDDNE